MTPLVLLHGWGLTPAVWRNFLPALPSGLDLHTPALPGHGGGAPPDSLDIADWADVLAPTLPDGAVVCGWSLGGMIAMNLARYRPEKVSRLVLIGSSPRFVAVDEQDWPHGLAAGTVREFIDNFEAAPEVTLKRFIALQTLGDAHRRAVGNALTEALIGIDGTRLPALSRGLRLLASSDQRAIPSGIRQPVTLIHGAADALMPVGAARWLANALPLVRLMVLDKCGHAPFLSRPDVCAEQLAAACNA
ncbi:MAG TPA: alpha/beta fold hydrolase [Aromatoleum sp.]|uniref:alpha/beta fold hydrolase n=1 Tax=Aromatoleum sp. TaxID=2307007 RepID=UPI002B48E16D|nr:alpha/beta fold hydrolase [Aromatoleum sp.]HJV27781.1 alpha/beta fold hydrolase [Aromatoleum sp.]